MPTPMLIAPWSPGLITVTFGEVIASGVADGSFATVEMSEDGIVEQVGEDGSVVLNQNLNELGQLTLRLLHQSPINGILLAIYNANRLSFGSGVRHLTVADENNKTLAFAPQAWIVRAPNLDYGDMAQPREWLIRGSPMRISGGI
jgi:hypothetical protein